MNKNLFKLLLFLFPLLLEANAKYIGSLLSGPFVAVPYTHFVIRNLIAFDGHQGLYNKDWKRDVRRDSYHSFQDKLECYFGLNDFFDLSLTSHFYFNNQGRYAYSNVGDLIAGLDFQLLKEDQISFLPGIKFAVREIFPLGNYQLFNPKRGYMEKSGSGCYSTQFALFFYKEYLLPSDWLVSMATEVQYQINSSINVKGFNAYGGGLGTDGKLLVGNAWNALFNVELHKKSFFFSLDTLYEHQDGSNFYGYPGLNFYGGYANPNQPSSERLSLAPSIAYQFQSQVGLMFGGWFSLIGRNTEQFSQYILNIFYTY